MIKNTLLALVLCVGCTCIAQENKYTLSPDLDIKPKGWNKVLCMKNGNTVLFHVEPTKRILVKVFDSTHKEIASRQDPYHILDVFLIENAQPKAIFEINKEAVLFMDQDRNGKHELVMLRYDATNGSLIEERLVGQSENENRRIRYYIMKNRDEENYSILFCMDKQHPKETDMFLIFFNEKHQSVREMPLSVDRKRFDYLNVLGAKAQPEGIMITIGMDSTTLYGHTGPAAPLVAGSSLYEHFIAWYFIPKGDTVPKRGIVDLSKAMFPYRAHFTYNEFAGTLNLLLYNHKNFYTGFGMDTKMGYMSSDVFFKIDRESMMASYNFVKDSIANDYLVGQTDSTYRFAGIPQWFYTNENGLSTIISFVNKFYHDDRTIARDDDNYMSFDMAITQVDDDGNEMWGTVLPCIRMYYQSPHYNKQFAGVDVYDHGRDFYFIYNDYPKNFNNTLKDRGDIVYYYENTDACYYKLNRKREVVKYYLFGQPEKDEYTSVVPSSGYLDRVRNVYAAVVQYKKNKDVSLRMGWSKLE